MAPLNLKPALFPWLNVATMASESSLAALKPVEELRARPVAEPIEHFTLQAATLPKLVVAVVSWILLLRGNILDQAKTYQLGWVSHIIIRDLIITLVGAGFWEWLLYGPGSPVKAAMAKRKFNPVYPEAEHFRFCIFWATVSTFIAAGIEIVYLHALANGLAWETNPWTAGTLLWCLTMPYWRITHFFIVHRFMHPWRTTSFPDIGKIVYKYVHSLHHKSYNPTAFSGISMHPVESFLYYTAALVPVLLGATHPIVFLLAKHDCTLAAMWGHDGFADPGSGSYPHYLHHAHFEVNYGENYVPLDYWFGTHYDGMKKARAD